MFIKTKIRRIKNFYTYSSKLSISERIKLLRDYTRLYKEKGIEPDEYFEFSLNAQSQEFRKSFLGINEQRFYLDYLNPNKYACLARNKFLTHLILENTGIKQSKLYCYYQPEGHVIKSSLIGNNLSEIRDIIIREKVKDCVIKTTESSHGENVIVIKNIEIIDSDCILYDYNNKAFFLSTILNKQPLIFEKIVDQSPQLSSFNPSSVNTIRFMTALYPDNKAKLIATFIKIGRSGACVDNAGDGGNVDACVDMHNGQLKYVIQFDGWGKIKEIQKHPDTGALLQGVVIENWRKIVEQVLKYQEAFPYMKVAGWDIAITNEGPVVIEVNDFWDRTGQFFLRKGWRNEIRDCYRAWRKRGTNSGALRKSNSISLKHLNKIVKRQD